MWQDTHVSRPREEQNGNRFKLSINRRRVEALININFGPNGDPPNLKNVLVALTSISAITAVLWNLIKILWEYAK